ncbi:hypothetical protein C3F09_02305 [candidate division GN15 bacterium]|uniref:FlgD Ig-like domain-containing protein n=1 Tax=candidate division GN15 bacterium TaxID=2072418 RepID=A0A855XBE9_9BACT|nr:MAG: hypothetical protein C3F09_02305 [candidate division GN15 bacterium]
MSKTIVSVFLGLVLSASVSAGPAMSFDHPDTTFASNVAIDIIRHANAVWLATSNGLNYTLDSGRTWLLYNSGNGLISSDVSAMCSNNGRLWVATNHSQEVQGSAISYSDGLSYSDDVGQTWTRVRFDSLTPPINYVYGAFRTIYDVAAAQDRIFFTAFAGGFLTSNDNGVTWQRLYASKNDSINFSDFYGGLVGSLNLRNEYFSCAVDTSHGDSFFVWAGTAAGILQYVFVQPGDKFYASQVHALAVSPDSNLMFVGGRDGVLSRGNRIGLRFSSELNLPADIITSAKTVGSNVLLGVFSGSSAAPTAPYLLSSDNFGDNFSEVSLTPSSGVVREFASVRNRIYLGADSGLYVSTDSGSTWSHIWVDSSNVTSANRRNIVNSVFPLGDTLWVGTDSGLVVLHLNATGVIDSSAYHVFAESDSTGSRVIRVRARSHGDTTAVWTVNRAATGSGVPMIGRWYSKDAAFWQTYQVSQITNDIGFIGDTVLFLQKYGVRMTRDTASPADPSVYFVVADSTDNTVVISDNSATSTHDSVFCMTLTGDTLVLGTGGGIAVSANRGKSFKVVRAQLNSALPDVVVNYTYLNTLNTTPGEGSTAGMTGDFVPALAVQYVPGSPARIYASCRRVDYGADGISWGRVILDTVNNVEIHRYRWDPIYTEGFAWNFENLGQDTLLLPTDQSLLVMAHPGSATLQTTDTLVFKSKRGQDLLFGGTPVYSVRADGDLIWVGTDDGIVRIGRDSLGSARLFIVTDPADEIYAFPTPFSPQRGQNVRFHFRVDAAAYVTLEVYDFAMNLVSRPIDNIYYAAGIYPPGDPLDSERPYWDGRNGRGDLVAVGVYYFKVTYSTGQVKWGKLAVMP